MRTRIPAFVAAGNPALRFLLMLLLAASLVLAASPARAALTPGAGYTIEVYPIGSDGTVGALAASDTVTADAMGMASFSLSGVPTRSQCNFILVVVKDTSGNAVRRALAPAPANAADATQLGVNPVTGAQTQALLDAMAAMGSDDPVMAVFGFTLVRSGGFSAGDLNSFAKMARYGGQAVETFLTNTVGEAKKAAFRAAVVNRLGTYTARIKEAVEKSFEDAAEARAARAQAGAALSEILVAAAGDAGIEPSLINVLMGVMGEAVERNAEEIAASEQAIASTDAIMSATYRKVAAEAIKQRYVRAMAALGATGAQAARVTAAIDALTDSILTAQQGLEELFDNPEAAPGAAALQAKQAEVNAAIQTAFMAFFAAIESTPDELVDMVTSMKAGLCGGSPACEAQLDAMLGNPALGFRDGMFTFGPTMRWPVTTVLAVTWVMDNAPGMSYVRDDLAIPPAMTWKAARNDFSGLPPALAALFGMTEDAEIILNRYRLGEIAASCDLTQAAYDALTPVDKAEVDAWLAASSPSKRLLEPLQAAENAAADDDANGLLVDWGYGHCNDLYPHLTQDEKAGLRALHLQRIEDLKGRIGGGLTDAQKQALLDVLSQPEM